MKEKKNIYSKQKLRLYFDENFPKEIIEDLKSNSYWLKRCKIYSAYDKGMLQKIDDYHFNYCKKNGFTLVTLDKDFMDDKKYPITKIPGIIIVVANKNEDKKIRSNLETILNFLSFMPYPRDFMIDTKIQVGAQGCTIRGRDSFTREIKTISVHIGDRISDVRKKYSY